LVFSVLFIVIWGKITLQKGTELIASRLSSLPKGPGVYRMTDAKGNPLYVGKAKSLRKRVSAYARLDTLTQRTRIMIAQTANLEIVTTHTEAEALILESNLIKELKPRYNIIFRDDKSFPFILLRTDTMWPQLVKHRGKRIDNGEYFGPFASAGAVDKTLNTLQKIFPLRTCSDSVFAGRTRPCLQYQIKRCVAPCVNNVSKKNYDDIVSQTRTFLSGRSQEVQRLLSKKMEMASSSLDFENAAIYRDRISALTQIQSRQGININTIKDADIIAGHQAGGLTCIQVFIYRSGQHYGDRTYFPKHAKIEDIDEVLQAFVGQFYSDKTPPQMVIVSHSLPQMNLVSTALSLRANYTVKIIQPKRGQLSSLVKHAKTNARNKHAQRLSESTTQRNLLEAAAKVLNLKTLPNRIEAYDNSHIGGKHAIGAMIVSGKDGFEKKAYRKFNIKFQKEVTGDDYGMMREVLMRRFSRALKDDPEREGSNWPDLVLIDGGPGHLGVAEQVMNELGISGLTLIAIAKGPKRNAGREKFYVTGGVTFSLAPNSPVLYFFQRLRDEAHRFAIEGHRLKRSKEIRRSIIDEIQGVGPKRKRSLLNHFGSAANVAKAGLADLELVEGINKTVAGRIYNHFNGG
tara:strand:- start:4578 stop:6464 length:1887 start_codon:yes stop_codon:yes gene_type:complete